MESASRRLLPQSNWERLLASQWSIVAGEGISPRDHIDADHYNTEGDLFIPPG